MHKAVAQTLWREAKQTIHGVDGNGDEILSPTPLGAAVLAVTGPDFFTKEHIHAEAQFLRDLADALES